MHTRTWLIILIGLIGSPIGTPSVGAASEKDCATQYLALREVFGRDLSYEKVMSRIAARLPEAKQNPIKEAEIMGQAFLDEIVEGYPPEYREYFLERIRSPRVENDLVKEPRPSSKEEIREIANDPAKALQEGLAMRREVDQLIEDNPMTLERAFYGSVLARNLDRLRAFGHTQKVATLPLWERAALIDITNPVPTGALRNFKVAKEVASRQWDYVRLIPKEAQPALFQELEQEKAVFLRRAGSEKARQKVDREFDELREIGEKALALSKGDFLAWSAKRFDWKGELKIDLIFRTLWYASIAGVLYVDHADLLERSRKQKPAEGR